MTNFTRLILLTLTVLLTLGFTTFKIYKPKKLNVKGDYKHSTTGIIFPVDFENYKRESITSFSKDNSNIGVSYFLNNSNQDPYFTIYIYPAPVAIEHRIRVEYFDCLQSIANVSNKGIDVIQKPIKISKNGYQLLGLSATISQGNSNTLLALFECGKYFVKYRISTNKNDTSTLVVF